MRLAVFIRSAKARFERFQVVIGVAKGTTTELFLFLQSIQECPSLTFLIVFLKVFVFIFQLIITHEACGEFSGDARQDGILRSVNVDHKILCRSFSGLFP